MPTHRLKIFCIILLQATSVVSAGAQNVICGTVTDSSNGALLNGAIICSVDSQGKMVSYCISNSDGGFQISIQPDVDALQIKLMGYANATVKCPLPSPCPVSLTPLEESIPEAIVTARKVQVAGDTIRYNIQALKRKDDVVLADVLRRIPGIDVDKLGFVKYNGKSINRFYINGKDLMESNYNLATQGLSPESVKNVEVLENHQPIKLLEGVEESELAGINIIMADNGSSGIKGRATASSGYELQRSTVPVSALLSAMYIRPSFSSVDVFGYDNQGFTSRPSVFSIKQDHSPSYTAPQRLLGIHTMQAPLENRRSLFNQTWEGTSINRIDLGNDALLSVTAKLGTDKRFSQMEQTSIYKNNGQEDWILDKTAEQTVWEKTGLCSVSYKKNGATQYLSDNLSFNYNGSSGLALISGIQEMERRTDGQEWNIENDGVVGFAWHGRVLRFHSYTQVSRVAEYLHLSTSDIRQNSIISLFSQDFFLSDIGQIKGFWHYSLKPDFRLRLFQRRTSSGNSSVVEALRPLDGKTTAAYYQFGLSVNLQYRRSPIEFGINGYFPFLMYRINQLRKGRLVPAISSKIKYVTGRWECRLSASAGREEPDIQSFGQTPIIVGEDTAWRGLSKPFFNPYGTCMLEIQYREPISGFNICASSAFRWDELNLTSREYLQGVILSALSDKNTFRRSVSSNIDCYKGLFSINGNISLSLNYTGSESALMQNNQTVPFRSHVLSTDFRLSMRLARWWDFRSSLSIETNHFTADQYYSSQTVNAYAQIAQSFHLSSHWSIKNDWECYYHDDIGQPIFFSDLSVLWSTPWKCRLSLQINNFFHNKHYSYKRLSPLLEENYSYIIRPLSILLGVEWSF